MFNQKKLVLCILVVLAVCSIFVGCDKDAKIETGSLTISTGSASKGFDSSISTVAACYQVTGSMQDETFSTVITTGTSTTVENLKCGTWTVKAVACNSDGTAIGEGTTSATVRPSRRTECTVEVNEYQGNGVLTITVDFADLESSEAVTATLEVKKGATVIQTIELSKEGNTATGTCSLGNGFYSTVLTVNYGDETFRKEVDAVHIVKDGTTAMRYEVSFSGGLSISIVNNIQSVPQILLSVTKATGSVEIAADVSGIAGTMVSKWYLNGEEIEGQTGTGITIASSSLVSGTNVVTYIVSDETFSVTWSKTVDVEWGDAFKTRMIISPDTTVRLDDLDPDKYYMLESVVDTDHTSFCDRPASTGYMYDLSLDSPNSRFALFPSVEGVVEFNSGSLFITEDTEFTLAECDFDDDMKVDSTVDDYLYETVCSSGSQKVWMLVSRINVSELEDPEHFTMSMNGVWKGSAGVVFLTGSSWVYDTIADVSSYEHVIAVCAIMDNNGVGYVEMTIPSFIDVAELDHTYDVPENGAILKINSSICNSGDDYVLELTNCYVTSNWIEIGGSRISVPEGNNGGRYFESIESDFYMQIDAGSKSERSVKLRAADDTDRPKVFDLTSETNVLTLTGEDLGCRTVIIHSAEGTAIGNIEVSTSPESDFNALIFWKDPNNSSCGSYSVENLPLLFEKHKSVTPLYIRFYSNSTEGLGSVTFTFHYAE